MAPVMSGNVNGQAPPPQINPPMPMPPMISRPSELGGILGEPPPGALLHPSNQYTLANMMNAGPPGLPGHHEREMLLHPPHPHGMPPGMIPQHVGPHPGNMAMARSGGAGGANPCFLTPEAKFLDFNRRLLQRNDDCDNIWWDSVISEYFEDDAGLMVSFIEDGTNKRYAIGRTLIPRYFRSIFDSGCTDYYYILRSYRESFHGALIRIESEACQLVMTYPRVIPPATVIVEGSLYIDFTLEESMRIRHWNFQVKNHREYMLRSIPNFNMNQEQVLRDLSNNITINGIPKTTLNFFRIANILEPMQELMSRQKAYSLNPKDCLKTTLFQKWQRMVAPPGQQQKSDSNRQSNKRRKRKGSNANSDSASNRSSKRKQSPVPSIPNINQPGDVMIVGEPTLMGGEFGEEDERSITRLENTQYDNTVAGQPPNNPGQNNQSVGGPMVSHGMPPGAANLIGPPRHGHHHHHPGHPGGLGPPHTHGMMGGGPQHALGFSPGMSLIPPHSMPGVVSPLQHHAQMMAASNQGPPPHMDNNNGGGGGGGGSNISHNPEFPPNSASTPNNVNNGPQINNFVKSEPRMNNCIQYPPGCNTPGTISRTSVGTGSSSLDQMPPSSSTLNQNSGGNSEDQNNNTGNANSNTNSSNNKNGKSSNCNTGPPRPTSQGGNQGNATMDSQLTEYDCTNFLI